MENLIVVSTVTPVYSGAHYLESLINEIDKVRSKWENSKCPLRILESIFVVDAAIDESEKVLLEMKKKFSWVKLLVLSKNYGQHPATIAGILHTSGNWIITLDEDLQHHPEQFEQLFIQVSKSSSDVVYAKSLNSVHNSWRRDLPAKTFKKIMSLFTGNKYIVDFNSFRLIRGEVARSAASVCAHETYFDIAICWFTNRIAAVSFAMRDERFLKHGKSGYSFHRLLSHARRLLISSNQKYLRFGVFLGLFSIAISLFLSVFVLLQKLNNPGSISVQGWTSLILTISFWGGISSLFSSLILEVLGNISLHVQGKPVFFVIDRSSDADLRAYFCEIDML